MENDLFKISKIFKAKNRKRNNHIINRKIYLTAFMVILTFGSIFGTAVTMRIDDGWGIGMADNNPPEAPTGLNPSWWLPGEKYELKFRAYDPDGDDISYFIDWGDGNTSGWIGPYGSNEDVTVSYSWDEVGNYEIVVDAKDSNGSMANDSYSFEITICEIQHYLEIAIIFGSIIDKRPVGDYIYFRVIVLAYLNFPGRLRFLQEGEEIVIANRYLGLIIEIYPNLIGGFFNAVIISDLWRS